LNDAHKTPQFWMLWGVLCLNVSAGIGVLGMASPMLQEVFGGKLIGQAAALGSLDKVSKEEIATIGAAFAALLSLFNIAGRIFWASLSDYLGRKLTYFIFFMAGIWLYTAVPFAGHWGKVGLFVGLFAVILTMYGGGFATIPAYLADLFGTRFVGAIHGRLLTAWSVAGILGPVLVNYLREFQIDRGVPKAEAYNVTLFILAGLLWLGFFCNLAVKPVAKRFLMTGDDSRGAAGTPGAASLAPNPANPGRRHASGSASWALVAVSWTAVGLPLVWGVSVTLQKAIALFR
jgi:MFS family permease